MKDLQRFVKDCAAPTHTTLFVEQTIEEALEQLRNRTISEKIIYFYVIDYQYRLLGVVSARNLLLHPPQTLIKEIMQKSVVSLCAEETLQEGLEILDRYKLLALPVVDKEHHLLGVIDIDHYLEESLDVANAHRLRDVFQMIGVYVEEGKKATAWKGYASRIPWIGCNLLGGLACAVISRFFANVLTQFIILAMFIPLLLTLSESISMQALAHNIHFPQKRKDWGFWKKIHKEWRVVALLGVTCGLCVGGVSLFWGEGFLPALTISIGIMLSTLLSAAFGVIIPVMLRSDPKLAAGPVVLMLADIITTTIYLSLGSLLLI